MKRIWILLLVFGAGAGAYYALLLASPEQGKDFAIDMQAIRSLANAPAGEKPIEIRYENVATLTFSEALQMAGDPWHAVSMDVYAYQVVFPHQTLIIDTAEDRATAKPEFLVGHYDDAAYERVSRALEHAAQIVVTHEHADHMGGIVTHPQPDRILPALRLTAEQVANVDGVAVLPLPAVMRDRLQPLRYDTLLAIAPGVVLIKAPGHTPGSQMVYVQRADGRELIFLGDVSWRLRNVEQIRERPLLMTSLIHEDRLAVLGQFRALHALADSEPAIGLVPGHERAAVADLEAKGLMQRGFR